MRNRRIQEIIKAKPTVEGAGVHLRRVFGWNEMPALDPFLLLDDFRSDHPPDYLRGFPWHPHRGIETITYVLRGEVEHGDSLGNQGVIGPGDVQWMTAGSGIIHQEMPKGDTQGSMHGFQLWANLPASHKLMDPRYRGIDSRDVPAVTTTTGATIRIICGSVEGVRGPVEDVVIDPEYLDVTIPAGVEFTHPTKLGHTVLAYVIQGQARFCHETDPYAYRIRGARYFDLERDSWIKDQSLVIFGDGEQVVVTAGEESARLLLLSGKPIREPIAWHGPIVMNTEEELRTAFEEYRAGTFIKPNTRGG
jgi:redox-sensitive bicupin YhaK (pirin superfamily)